MGGVSDDSPAAKAGLKTGDVIVEFAGKKVNTPQELQESVEESAFGRQVTVAVLRDGKRVELKVTPTEAPGDAAASENGHASSSSLEKLGMELQDLTPELAAKLGIRAGHGAVVTSVQQGSAAEKAGLASGMVIVEANRTPVKSAADLAKVLDEKSLSKGVLLLVRGEQGSRFVVLRS